VSKPFEMKSSFIPNYPTSNHTPISHASRIIQAFPDVPVTNPEIVPNGSHWGSFPGLKRFFNPPIDKHGKERESTKVIPFDTPGRMLLLGAIKRWMYAQVGILNSLQILRGKQEPFLDFQIETNPPSIFVNYKIKPETLDEFKKALKLPESVKLMPVSCLEGDKPEYILTLNAYRVSGNLVNGLRGEWSTFIDRGDGKPSFLVVDAFSDVFSMDPVNVVTRKFDFTYPRQDNDNPNLDVSINTPSAGSYRFHYPSDAMNNAQEKLPNRDWMAANDYIFWRNGVCDHVYMDGNCYNSPVKRLPLDDCKSEYNMEWKPYIEEKPFDVLALTAPARFIVSPWSNIKEAEHHKPQTNLKSITGFKPVV
jgi:hypothetical protein